MLKKVSKVLILWGLVGVMTLFGCAALAQEGTTVVASGSCGPNVTWTLNSEGVLTIFGSGEMEDYYFPPWHSESESIRAVVIENGVTLLIVLAKYLLFS